MPSHNLFILLWFHTVASYGRIIIWGVSLIYVYYVDTMSRSIIRGIVSQVRRMQTIEYTPEGAVTISYPTLVSSPLSLNSSIGQYFIR